MDGESIAKVLPMRRLRLSQRPAFTETYFKKETKASVIYGFTGYTQPKIQRRAGSLNSVMSLRGPIGFRLICPQPCCCEVRLDAWEIEVARLAAEAGDAVEAPMDAETQKMLEAMGYVE